MSPFLATLAAWLLFGPAALALWFLAASARSILLVFGNQLKRLAPRRGGPALRPTAHTHVSQLSNAA